MSDDNVINLREQILRIDKIIAETDHKRADNQRILVEIDRIVADRDRKRQETRLAPWQLAVTMLTAGAALFAAGGVFVQLITHLARIQ